MLLMHLDGRFDLERKKFEGREVGCQRGMPEIKKKVRRMNHSAHDREAPASHVVKIIIHTPHIAQSPATQPLLPIVHRWTVARLA